MSLPMSWITCDKCREQYSGDVAAGRFFYEFPDGIRFPLIRQLGWCEDCWTVVAMEDLATHTFFERKLEAHRKERAKYGGLKMLIPSARLARQTADKAIAQLMEHVRFRRQRSSPPKCLKCGSPHVSPLPHLAWPAKPGIYLRTGWTHPGCGGTMLTHGDEIFVSEVFPTSIFSPDGLLVKEIADNW